MNDYQINYYINNNVKNPINKYMSIICNIKDRILKFKKLQNSKNNIISMFFRGEGNGHLYPNISGILRSSTNREKESVLYNSYKRYFIGKLSKINNPFDQLEFMQHYGLYTRLLDITKDPLVALYFACAKHVGKTSGFIYVFFSIETSDSIFNTSLNFNDDGVKLLSTLSTMGSEDKALIINYINVLLSGLKPDSVKFLKNCKYRTDKFLRNNYKENSHKYNDINSINTICECIKTFYSQESIKKLYFKSFLSSDYPLNVLYFIDKSLIVNPDKNNDRIKAQDGYFLFQSYCSKTFQSAKNISKDVCKNVGIVIKISKNCKKRILIGLDRLYGINKAKLFPDYSSVAAYLDKHINDL